MRTYRRSAGPFSEQPFFKKAEVDQICEDELRKTGLMPDSPKPIRVERFIEKRFGVTPQYDHLSAGILGYTVFVENGVRSIHVARQLEEDQSPSSRRRASTTLAHEAGHCLLHAHLFAFRESKLQLFQGDDDLQQDKILCRGPMDASATGHGGRWWEYQANLVIGGLLLPRPLVHAAIQPFLTVAGLLETNVLSDDRREEAWHALADIFDVNPVVVRYRLEDLCQSSTRGPFL